MKKTIVLFMLMIFCLTLFSATPINERLKSYEKHVNMKDDSFFKNMKWKNIGPYFMGGRIVDIEGYNHKHDKFLIATASGGLWKTENNATTWTPIFDHESSITIGDIAISQSNENLIWVGTGENNSSRSSYAGTGLFKSTDNGKTWKHMGLGETHHIGRIIVHPANNKIVYVAAMGHLYTDNPDRGLYVTRDGGMTWKKTLYIDQKTGIIDLVIHPQNPDILYAASWQKERKAWNMVEGGPGSAIYKSTDGGHTWQTIMEGFPQGKYVGRIGLDISRTNPDIVYALLDNQEPKPQKKKKVKKSKSGITIAMLQKMSKEDFLKIQDKNLQMFMEENKVPQNYTTEIVKNMVKSDRVTPQVIANMLESAQQKMFSGNVKGAEVYRSDNGGLSWRKTHKQYIDLVFTYGYYFGEIRVSPGNKDTIYILGVPTLKSTDGGKTFKDVSAQGGIYGVNGVHADMHSMWIDPKNPKRIMLGTDGGLNISYDEAQTWQKINNICLAQCYTINYDFQEPYNIYTGLQDNGVNVGPSNFKFGNRENIWKMILGGDGAFVQPEPGNPELIYAAYQFGSIHRIDTKNGKEKNIRPKSQDKKTPYRFNWLSPFLISHHNPYTLYIGGNKVLKSVDRGDNWIEISADLTNKKNTDGDVPYATITALDESTLSSELLFVGTDDGNLWVKKSVNSNWEPIKNGLPDRWVTRVVASKYKKERVYVTLTGYREDDFNTYVYISDDFGKNWKSLKGNLPEEAVNVIREDTENENILYLGTDLGIYVSLDMGGEWHSLKNNLPTNAVYDIKIHPREKDLIIGTHGRGVFLLPVANIQKLTADVIQKKIHLFDIPVTSRASRFSKVSFQFYTSLQGNIQLQIQDGTGKKVKTMSIVAQKGINTFEWNLILDKAKKKMIKAGEYQVILQKGKIQEKGKLIIK